MQNNMKNKKSAKPTPKHSETNVQKPIDSSYLEYWETATAKYGLKVILGLLIVGLLLRILNLDALSLWVDEFVHVNRADNYLNGTGTLFTEDNNGILYTMFLLPLFKMLGSTAFIARLPSVLFGVGMIYLTYRIAARLFNQYIGVLSAFGVTFSIYLIFWSRIGRNYAIFGFFYLLFFWLFLKAFESKEGSLSGKWKQFSISPQFAMLLPLALILSLLSHQLTFFFIFSLASYCLVYALWLLIKNDPEKYRNKYFYLSLLLIPTVFLILTPVGQGIVTALLSPILSADQIVWALPNWGTLSKQWKSEPFTAFKVYNDVLRYDTGWLYFTGLLGIISAWFLNRKSALWLCSMLLVPFVLLSFVYREPSVHRYSIFVHPFFWMASAVFFWMLWKWLAPYVSRRLQFAFLIIPFVLVLLTANWKSIGDLTLARQKSGFVVDAKIGGLNFTNWNDVCQYVSKKRAPDEVVMATLANGVSYYLKDKNVIPFRQADYDTQKKHQVFNKPKLDGSKNASSYEDLVYTVTNTPKGWLLADYYLESSFVDDKARQFVYRNMHFIPDASSDGDVLLFKWDNSIPKPENQNMVVELGRASSKVSSRVTNITVSEELLNSGSIKMAVRTANIDSKDEAFVVFNKQYPVFLPVNQSNVIETHMVTIDKSILKPGNNIIQVGYNPKVKQDPRSGFVLYFFSLTEQ